MPFQVKMPENGKKNTCRDNKTTRNVILIILDLKELTEM